MVRLLAVRSGNMPQELPTVFSSTARNCPTNTLMSCRKRRSRYVASSKQLDFLDSGQALRAFTLKGTSRKSPTTGIAGSLNLAPPVGGCPAGSSFRHSGQTPGLSRGRPGIQYTTTRVLHCIYAGKRPKPWIPACAGMTTSFNIPASKPA